MSNIQLGLVPLRTALCEERDNTVDVLVRVQAPATPSTGHHHLPLNLALVIDRSGSMAGRPLHEARRCAAMIIDSMAPTDHCSLVVYDHQSDVLVPAQPVGDRTAFQSALGGIEPGGTTALYDGWLTGAEQAATASSNARLSRVLLLSDGMANVGLNQPRQIARRCAELAAAGVSTSTYGLGQNFNEELMTAMAIEGQGNAHYGQTAEDLEDPFREELDLVRALCARTLRLASTPGSGIRVEVLNQYPVDAEGRSLLPDLAYGSEAWALIRLTVPRDVVHSADVVHLLTATIEYRDLDGEIRLAGPVHLKLPRLPADAFATIAPDDLVVRRLAEVRAASVQEQARRAARDGDWLRVQHLLSELKAEVGQHPWLSASIDQLERYARERRTQPFAKEAQYKAYRMRTRLAPMDESRDWSEAREANQASFLRRKREQGRRFGSGNESPSD
jgi:Ca-activated chloride channel family protein